MPEQEPSADRKALSLENRLEGYFKIRARGSSVRTEIIAGLTTFLAMVYSVVVVPKMLGAAREGSISFGTLVAGLGSPLP